MSDIKRLGIPITLDCERNLIFNINVLELCIEQFGSIENMLNEPFNDLAESVWLAVAMLNEDAEIWNEEHPDAKKSLVDEKKIKRYTDGVGGIKELGQKIREALLKGLPADKVAEVEEVEKNLIAVQGGTKLKLNRAQRRNQK